MVAVTTVPVPGVNPTGPYSISKEEAEFVSVQDIVAEVAVMFEVVIAVGVKQTWSTTTSSKYQLSPPPICVDLNAI